MDLADILTYALTIINGMLKTYISWLYVAGPYFIAKFFLRFYRGEEGTKKSDSLGGKIIAYTTCIFITLLVSPLVTPIVNNRADNRVITFFTLLVPVLLGMYVGYSIEPPDAYEIPEILEIVDESGNKITVEKKPSATIYYYNVKGCPVSCVPLKTSGAMMIAFDTDPPRRIYIDYKNDGRLSIGKTEFSNLIKTSRANNTE